MNDVVVAAAREADRQAWAALRGTLWSHASLAEHAGEIDQLLRDRDAIGLVARIDGEVAGFAEATLRHDYVNGCSSSPVAFLEGLFVAARWRRRGAAAALVAGVAGWARTRGVRELASDASLDNAVGQALHVALGFAETERVVFFRRDLSDGRDRPAAPAASAAPPP